MLKLSKTSKMPCCSFALPAGDECITGRKLMALPGSVCKSCYARKGHSHYPAVKAVRTENLRLTREALKGKAARGKWVADMVKLIADTKSAWFRWHDSGDLQSAPHLRMISEVCRLTPDVIHWLPTREYKFVQMVQQVEKLPENLTVRLSAHLVGKVLESKLPTSSVGSLAGYQCPATYNTESDGQCLDCRACWDKKTVNIDYRKH